MTEKKEEITKTEAEVTSDFAEVDNVVAAVKKAQEIYATFSQEQVDKIFQAAAIAAASHRISLSKMAVAETGMGVMEDKVIKNHFAAEYIYNQYKNDKTCGVVEDDPSFGYRRIAEPIGIVAAVIPTTNPTSTAIFKALLALKTRNGMVFAPHPRARKCTDEAVRMVLDAAISAGAPENILGFIRYPTPDVTGYLMKHKDINLILATGGPGMVKAAYSSGKPAIGVGAGNTPVIIDATADVKMSVSSVIMSKTFDNGMICASEQAIIVDKQIDDVVKKEFVKRGCYFVKGKEKEKLRETIFQDGKLNSAIVGQSAFKIAELAGIKVDPATKILIGEVDSGKVELDDPFAHEKLSPVLGYYVSDNFEESVKKAKALIALGGAGHTSVAYVDENEKDKIKLFETNMRTGRTLINMPAAQGAIGDVYNFKLPPSLTLGCGSWGGNSVSENIGVKHLMNIKSVAARRENMLWYKVPPKIYFKRGATEQALQELAGKKRAFIVTDKTMEKIGHVKKIVQILESLNIAVRVFSDVLPDPTLTNVKEALTVMGNYEPDVFISLGGGSPMDAAKIMWVMYENPELKFEDIAMRFMDIRKRICKFPEMGKKAIMVAIPTTSGTGSEVTPFTVITDDRTGIKYPITDYELTPDMAIVDPEFVLSMPKNLTAWAGLDVLTHAIEAYTSIMANNFSDGHAIEAIRLVFKYLKRSYDGGSTDIVAKEKMHYAATIAGMAFANGFLGVCHSMAHKLGSMYGVPHGLANALLLPYVIKFNATDNPTKQGLLPQYKYPFVKGRFAKIINMLNLGNDLGDDIDAKVDRLVEIVEDLKASLNVPKSIQEVGVKEQEFLDRIDELSEQAFDDQCTGANPRYPLVPEIKELYLAAYYGKPTHEKKK